MKFSKSKKKKMKKIRQRRIRKSYGYVIGLKIPCYSCLNNPVNFKYVEVIDKISIRGELYFLVASANNEIYIYKVLDKCRYAYVSKKKLKKYKNYFENYNRWKEKTIIHITDEGHIHIEDEGYLKVYDYGD